MIGGGDLWFGGNVAMSDDADDGNREHVRDGVDDDADDDDDCRELSAE